MGDTVAGDGEHGADDFLLVVRRARLTVRRFDERHPDATDEARRIVMRRALRRVVRFLEREWGARVTLGKHADGRP